MNFPFIDIINIVVCLTVLSESFTTVIVAESKEGHLRSDDFGKDIASVQALLSKQVCLHSQ